MELSTIQLWVLWCLQQLKGNSVTLIALVGQINSASGRGYSEKVTEVAVRALKKDGLIELEMSGGSMRCTLTEDGGKVQITKPYRRQESAPVTSTKKTEIQYKHRRRK